MKKLFALLLTLALLLSSAALAENVVKIGVFEPASGDSGAGGKQEMLGMQYANYLAPTVEIGGEEYTVELVYADNASSTDKAPSAAQQLVSAGVSLVLGSYGSGVSIAGSPYFEDAGIPAIGVTCTNPAVTEGNTHYFRICFLDPFQGTVLANYAYNELGARTAYCLAELGNDYDVGLAYYFQQAFEALGGTVISENFPTGNADFTSYLSTATAMNAEVFFAPCSLAYTTQIVDQAAAQAVTFPLLGSDTWDSNVIINAASGKDVKIYITTFYQEGASPEFDQGIKDWMNANPEMLTNNGGNDMVSAVTAMGYDAYFVALEALKAAGTTDPAAVNEALWNVTYEGVSGAISFNEIGDANRDSAFIKTANTADNCWEFVTVQTVE
ncbi:MAG TPA: ABC transporter substrate-binding protein [Candidatus Pullichristensenella excrementigallinarum]|uniref:ABC transporter substrate-binding protein n=1 Tax=Candidatus Pullichristensenella excrementigallinarum TaxID=2840907 RepID=A0A9D1ICV5_9FIRM|nr:ABC transporter substrate-binding protein [Candidatus Pullichristensenella excrementigallinarum]